MEINIGYRAATRQSYADAADMKKLVARLRYDYPQAGLREIISRFRERAYDDEEFFNACTEYAVISTWNNMENNIRRNQPPSAAAVTAKATEDKILQNKAAAIVNDVLELNREMPNGKRLRFCTREDILGFAEHNEQEASWQRRMAKKMKPAQMVGQAFSEAEVKAILK